MKQPADGWESIPPFDPGPPPHDPPFEEDPAGDDTPQFAAIRKIELLGRLHHMAFRTLFKADGLPPAQAGAMKVVLRYPGLSQRELADHLHIQRATATVMLQKMEKAGYVDRRPDRDDQRISRIYPTELARATDAENQKAVFAYFSRCFGGISEADFQRLVRTLEQVEQNIRAILAETPDSFGKE